MSVNEISDIDRLNGWVACLGYPLSPLNEDLLSANKQSPDSSLYTESVITPGTAWSAFRGIVGAPLLQFGSGSGNEAMLTVSRKVSQAVHLLLGRDPGRKHREIRQVDAEWGSAATLSAQTEVFNHVGIYQADGSIVLNWKTRPRYSFIQGGVDDPIRAARLVEGLEQIGEPMGWLGKRDYLSPPLVGARFRLVVGTVDLGLRRVWLYFSTAPEADGRAEAGSKDTPLLVVCHYNGAKMPSENWAGRDLLELPYFLYPHGKLQAGVWQELGSKVWELRFSRSHGASAEQATAPASLSLLINPVVRVVQRGVQPLKLEHNWGSLADMALRPGGAGEIEQQGDHWYYRPPALSGTAVVYNEKGKTQQPPALKSSVMVPVDVDFIDAKLLNLTTTSACLLFNMPQTHFLRMSVIDGALYLRLFYVNKSGTEVPVDTAQTEWSVLAGDGKVSQEGAFTPGRSLSGCTVIQAVDPDDYEWYWAVLVIPDLAPDELLKLQA
ncbi:hypothetical protein [Pseudomonas faucium]|uniref:hypothetical protein n=1 Tax=Pseudomonas faucium TaxID=2740518 RepID=UPI001F253CD1|nr:hypothetical protein [Pseudomonas faucium]